MAFTDGNIGLRGHLYDMTGVTSYNQASGVDLGLISGPIEAKIERAVTTYSRFDTGGTPREASIDGSGIRLRFQLQEYDAAVMKVIAQQLRPASYNSNYHGVHPITNYKLGRLLGTGQLLSLMIADKLAPADYPKLYLHRAVITDIDNLDLSFGGPLMAPATIEVMGLYSTKIGDCFLWGNPAGFPSLT